MTVKNVKRLTETCSVMDVWRTVRDSRLLLAFYMMDDQCLPISLYFLSGTQPKVLPPVLLRGLLC